MAAGLDVRGELVFESEDECKTFLKKLEIDINSEAKEGKGIKVIDIIKRDGRCHIKFEGKVDWPSRIAPQNEDPLDWLESQVLALVWDVEDLKTLEVYRKREDLSFEFYTEDELNKKREDYNKWWMDSVSNIVGLF